MAIRDGLEERAARITTQRDWPMRCMMPKTFSPVLDVIASLCSHLAT
ncbi:MAG: hypothetical protein H7Y15_01650 [Pseudonocardia sp.]|nr:hypothetical protein [Pseudonocardia sp.]